jgi:hypothetical protein
MQEFIKALAAKLAGMEFTLRSGGAKGADQAFELGWLDWYANQSPWPSGENVRAEIYIPWDGYEKHDRDGLFGATKSPKDVHFKVWEQAEQLAAKIHPAWDAKREDGTPVLTQGAKTLHTRNVFQVLGPHLDNPSTMLICWAKVTRGGNISGGTATAWKLARQHGVPCFNLAKPEDYARIQKFVEGR